MESHLSSSSLLLGANGGWKFSAAPPSLTGVANKKLFPYSRYEQRERGEGAAKIFHLLSSISFFASDFLARSLSLLLPPSTLLSQEASLLPSHPPSFGEVSSFFLFLFPEAGGEGERRIQPGASRKGRACSTKLFRFIFLSPLSSSSPPSCEGEEFQRVPPTLRLPLLASYKKVALKLQPFPLCCLCV